MAQKDPPNERLEIRELHPTFGAEVLGADFSKHVQDQTLGQIRSALAKVDRS